MLHYLISLYTQEQRSEHLKLAELLELYHAGELPTTGSKAVENMAQHGTKRLRFENTCHVQNSRFNTTFPK